MSLSKFFVAGRESSGPTDWRVGLSDPEKHWKIGHSARALAYCWEQADGFPSEVVRTFDEGPFTNLRHPRLIIGHPEHVVPLPGGRAGSQNDIFALGTSQGTLFSMSVEGKVSEDFDQTIGKWINNVTSPRSGKHTRLAFLKRRLGLSDLEIDHIRYQLMHRTVSALLEAERLRLTTAIMLVHSFSQEDEHLEDYQEFVKLFDARGDVNTVSYAGAKEGVELYLAWVRGEAGFLRV